MKISTHTIYRLIVITSGLALFRVEFSGRGELSERQQKLGQHLGSLVRIAEEFNVAVVIVNQWYVYNQSINHLHDFR